MSIIKIINDFKNNDSMLWVENNSIRLFVADHFKSNELKNTITEFKTEIFDFLIFNEIFSKAEFQSKQIFRRNTQESLLSFAQERLWFIEQFEEGTNAYHIPVLYELDATANKEGLKHALQQIVTRHEVLRSTIEQGEDDEFAIQKVNEAPLSIQEITWSETDDYELLITEEINRPFNLSSEYPIRVNFYTIKSETETSLNKTILLINIHHIATDGWSKEIFEKEVLAYYDAYLVNNKAFKLPELEIQYKDYALWQRDYLTGDILEKQLGYWKEKLTGYQILEFPTDYARPSVVDYRGASQEFSLNKELSEKLRDLAQREAVTLNSLLLSSVTVLLGKYTGQNDIVIGTAIANRHHRQTEGLIGFFVNMQANRTILNSSQSFEDLIQQTHNDQINAQMHQDLPFEKLIDELGVDRDTSRHSIFQVMFGVQSFGSGKDSFEYNDAAPFRSYDFEDVYEAAKYDLSIFIDDSQEELLGEISYATSLFTKESIARLANHYAHLLDELTKAPNKAYNEISLLSSTDYQQLVYNWNATDKEYSKDKTIQEFFEEQVEKTPNNIALVYEGEGLTYNQLNEKSNQLAHHIRSQYKVKTQKELTADTLIALCLERSFEMIIGILGVLKAGGAYVPIDPSLPQERIDYVLEDTQTELVLSQRHLNEKAYAKLPQNKVVYIDLSEALYKTQAKMNLPQQSQSKDLAYVIYTSGTTGKPKGAMLNHSGIVNRIEWMQNMYPLNSEDVVLQKTPYVFDVSVWELLWANWYGAKIVMAKPEGHKDSEYLHQLIQKEKVTTLHFVPSMLEAYNHYLLEQENKFNPSIKQIFCSGEALNNNTVQQTYKNSIGESLKLHNLYGPTEASIDVTFYETAPNKNVYIGKPIQNTQVYILSPNQRPVPIGVIGELYLGGIGLSRGYLNRPELTAERFVDNPFATQEDKIKGYTKLYKTGDLVRWLADGNIEYLGRNDDQVKIRGYRIELGEIEHAISQITGIKQVSVQARDRITENGSSKYLVGYYVLNVEETGLTVDTIESSLSGILPDYMIPTAFVEMESFPLTVNGKLNKRLFTDPDFNSSDSDYVEPVTEEEKETCKIWSNLLSLDRVGITDNFFKIGGNSILALQVSHRMSKILGCNVKVADVFKYKTITQLLAHAIGQSQIIIPKVDVDQIGLSFAQERLWFIEQFEEGSNAFHMPALYELDATINKEGLKHALQQIVIRHEVLRSTIEQRENDEYAIQKVHEESLSIQEITWNETDDYELLITEEINRPFNLSNEYPIRVNFYNICSNSDATINKTILLINIHHIASDGWSKEVFEREVLAYYNAYLENNTTFKLPELEIQYKDYALWQRNYLTGDVLEKQLGYWKEKLTGYQVLEFPTDYARPSVVDYSGASQEFSLNKELSKKIRDLAQREGVTLNSLLLSAVNILLGKYTGQKDIVIGSPIANRHHSQTEGLIGFFVNTQVNRTQLNASQNFKELIKQVHQGQIEAQLHQDLPFEKLIAELGVDRDTSRHSIFQVMFGVQSFGSSKESFEYNDTTPFKPYELKDAYEVAKFDLSIFIDDSEEELAGEINYATSLFTKESIIQLANHYVYLLDELTKDSNKEYSQISLLSPKDYQELIYNWNATDKVYPKDKTIQELFQEQVLKTPNNVALVSGLDELTYNALHEKSNQLARYIREQYQEKTQRALTPDTLIVLCMDRSLEMIIGILAVLKAGGTYVPIDPSYPQDRIDYFLEDTQATIILSQRKLKENNQVKLPQDKVIAIDLSEELYLKEDTVNLEQYSQSTDLAYIIYTSGTTGRPKGVMIEHHSVINYSNNVNEVLLPEIKNVDFSTNLAFDLSVTTTISSLLLGKKIFIYSDTVTDVDSYAQYLVENKIDFVKGTPSLLANLSLNYFSNYKIKQAFIGGEKLEEFQLDYISKYIDNPIDEYGPTEATVGATYINKKEIGAKGIGKPYFNFKNYVLDSNNVPVPIGVIGELHIGGASLSRGYLNRPELTAERFIDNPFATEADKAKGYTKLYKTGDLVRWLSDGSLEYLGRNDNQVKIRGYRIELGEIEHTISQIEGIKQACVLAKERKTEVGSTKYLVGYYVLDRTQETNLDSTSILEKLSQGLPDYMVPSALVALESLPLTINGKLDKRALPDPDFNAVEDYVKPETELEIKLCVIYAEVLGLASDQVSIHQNFFKMGGNSILSLQLKQKLNRLDEFNNISIADLFKHNSILKLIQSIGPNTLPKYQLQSNSLGSSSHEIAIIGSSGAFSGANNITELWDLIANQKEGIKFYNKEQCVEFGVEESLLNLPNFVAISGDVEGTENFDPLFWGISPNEAKQLNPQIRKFIEHSWFVLESTGYSQQRKNQNIGVFAGSGNNDYFYDHILNGEMSDQINMWEASASNSKDALATKTAFFLGLSGPANSINTACSTGLVSVVEACKNLQLGVCHMALAGGVSLGTLGDIGYVYEEGMISSKDGHCRTFDYKASGTIGASGVGVVLLKRLEDAIKDGDTILGVIKGYASNNDGDRKTGYTAPSIIGQSECIINAQRMAGVSSNEIDYVECHGTATHLGDPIEVQALREAFAFNEDKEKPLSRKTVLGAVKANIGHTDSAAGTASLIKVCAMLQNNTIPGQVNFESPNPELGLEQTNFEILKQNREWLPSQEKQRLAGVSSFGVGGTNAHVVIGDYIVSAKEQEKTIVEGHSPIKYIVPLSAKSRSSLEQNKTTLLKYLAGIQNTQQSVTIRDIAYSLQQKKEQFNHRSAYCAQTVEELITALKESVVENQVNTQHNAKTVFMFPGQGAQYTGMLKSLYDNEPNFKNVIDKCIGIANQYLEIDLNEVMYPTQKPSQFDINQTQWSQITLFIIEYGLSEYLTHIGVKADAYIGHSIGEYVAATLSGVFSLEDAIKTVISRGQLMQSMESGSMLAIHSAEIDIQEIVKEYHCEIAVINSSENIVVSGTHDKIQSLKMALENRGIISVKLNVSHAYHSVMMEGALDKFEKVFSDVKLNTPKKKFISNLTGAFAAAEVTSARYWCNQLRNTVQFSKGIHTLSVQYNHQLSFIEVGPGKALCSFINVYKKSNNYKYLDSVQLFASAKEAEENKENQLSSKEALIAKLWMNGIINQPNYPDLFHQAKFHQDLPVYQFDFQKCWLERVEETKAKDQLTLLPKEKWLSAPVWVPAFNLDKQYITDVTVYKNALIFIREEQLNLYDFSIIAKNSHLIVLDVNHQNTNIFITDNNQFKLNPQNENHFKELSQYLNANNIAFETIIHLSSINNLSDSERALSYSFYPLFLIRQYLLNNIDRDNLLVLTNGLAQITNDDIINPFNGTLVGAMRNINNEFLNLDARIIDIGYENENIFNYINHIVKDANYKKTDELLAVKFGKLWIERFENVANLPTNESRIKDGDVILITGNLSSFALPTAKYIASKHKVKFILISSDDIYKESIVSAYEIERFEIIKTLKAFGSSFDFECVDLYSFEKVNAFIEKTKAIYGNITGIIHTEGASPLDINEYQFENVKNAFKGRIYGLDHLINSVDLNHLNFIASKSSLSSLIGDVNRIEFCASNSYLDYLSVNKKKFINTKIISVNWLWWYDNYTSKEELSENKKTQNFSQDLDKLMYLNSVDYNEGSELFYHLINQTKHDQLAVSKLNIKELKDKLFSSNNNKPTDKEIRILEEDYSETEFKIAKVFANILGLEEISIYDDFFKIGGNSILAIRASHQITELFNIDIGIADLFKHKCTNNLKNILVKNTIKVNIKREKWTI